MNSLFEALAGLREAQKLIFDQFHDIELRSGLIPLVHKVPVDLNSYEGQELIRLYCWRIAEEVAEVKTAIGLSGTREELADVLTFLLDLMIITGCTPKVAPMFTSTGSPPLDLIYTLGAMSNLLKNRPWREVPSAVLIEPSLINSHLGRAVSSFYQMYTERGFQTHEVISAYVEKNTKNERRIANARRLSDPASDPTSYSGSPVSI